MIRIFMLLLGVVSLAHGQPQEAVLAYNSGDYGTAAALTEGSDRADDLAFSARSVLAGAMSTPSGNPAADDLSHAEMLARRAIELDESHIEGRLQLAISMSLQARPMSNRQAMRVGLGQKAKDIAKAILVDDPNDAYANALLAVWNMEILRRGGRIGARIMGASVRAARAHYETAAAAAPDDGALHWQWARVLAATNAKKYRVEIEAALAASLAARTDDALERVMQSRAKRLQEVLEDGDLGAVKALAAALL